jgi:uncharacterized membrane protein
MNDDGHVVGLMQSNTESVGFVWRGGSPIPLARLHNDDFAASPFGINNRGDIVGLSGSSPVLWPGGGTPIDLSTRAAGSGWTLRDARFINDDGQIVGIGEFEGKGAWYFLDTDGTVTKIIDTVFPKEVRDLSQDGRVVGIALSETSFVWRRGEPRVEFRGNAFSINSNGMVTGFLRFASIVRGVTWDEPYAEANVTEIVPFDPAHTVSPQSVADDGNVVGFFSGPSPGGGRDFIHAFLWRDGRFSDLSALHGAGTNQQRAIRVGSGGRVLLYSIRPTEGGDQTFFMVVDAQ